MCDCAIRLEEFPHDIGDLLMELGFDEVSIAYMLPRSKAALVKLCRVKEEGYPYSKIQDNSGIVDYRRNGSVITDNYFVRNYLIYTKNMAHIKNRYIVIGKMNSSKEMPERAINKLDEFIIRHLETNGRWVVVPL